MKLLQNSRMSLLRSHLAVCGLCSDHWSHVAPANQEILQTTQWPFYSCLKWFWHKNTSVCYLVYTVCPSTKEAATHWTGSLVDYHLSVLQFCVSSWSSPMCATSAAFEKLQWHLLRNFFWGGGGTKIKQKQHSGLSGYCWISLMSWSPCAVTFWSCARLILSHQFI